ncbi:MAG: hypothetical protein FJ118_15200 [Deltaproteobacteria bacterium]|nr:hypothetical protein [Deltaproteobacteria bacterium]
MFATDQQRRWWFATHPEYSQSHKREGTGKDNEGGEDPDKVSPKDVDDYVDNALRYETEDSVIALLNSVKRNFGAQAHPDEDEEFGDNSGNDWWSQQPEEPEATIGPPRPPDLSDHARNVLDIVCPGLTKAYDRWRSGYYERYPWAPGPLYDALGDLLGLVAVGLTKIQAALAKAVNLAETAALQNARQELLKVWDLANFLRGWAIEDLLGRNLPRTFRGIDRRKDGVATSIKSTDLRLKSYQDPAKTLSRGRKYVDQLVNFDGASMKRIDISDKDIIERVLRLGVPPGATKAQKSALGSLIEYGRRNGVKVEVITVP